MVSYWEDTPCWRFDSATYERQINYPALDSEKISAIENRVAQHAAVEHCVLTYPYDPSLASSRPILIVQPTSADRIPEVERFCREALARGTSPAAAAREDAVQFWKLPLTADGTIDRTHIERAERARLTRGPHNA